MMMAHFFMLVSAAVNIATGGLLRGKSCGMNGEPSLMLNSSKEAFSANCSASKVICCIKARHDHELGHFHQTLPG